MKKTYEKPRLSALSLSGNDMLCNTCAFDVIGSNANTGLVEIIESSFDVTISTNSFSSTDPCSEAIEGIESSGYCKFNGAETMTVFNS